jgi:hypothetical protein
MTGSHNHFIREFFLLSCEIVGTHGHLPSLFHSKDNGVFHLKIVKRLTKASLLSECHVLLWFMRKMCNVSSTDCHDTHKYST